MNISSRRFGFTVIELLVVVAIIGVFSGVILAALNSARDKGADAARLSAAKALQTAIEIYKLDNPGSLPNCYDMGYAGGCDFSHPTLGGYVDSSMDGTFMEFLTPYLTGRLVEADSEAFYGYLTNAVFPPASTDGYEYIIAIEVEDSANATWSDPAFGDFIILLGQRIN